jgi:hypothetical protein
MIDAEAIASCRRAAHNGEPARQFTLDEVAELIRAPSSGGIPCLLSNSTVLGHAAVGAIALELAES